MLCEVAYSQRILKKGVYLSVADLAMMSKLKNKAICMVYWDNEHLGKAPPVVPLQESLTALAGRTFPDLPKCDMPDENTWCVGVCRADYRRDGFQQLNHFVPLYQEAVMTDQLWHIAATEKRRKLQKRIERTQQQVEEASDEEWAESLQDNVLLLKNQEAFMSTLHSVGLHPNTVPGDGDCMLWTILALQGGPVVGCQMNDRNDVQSLREESLLFIFTDRFVFLLCLQIDPTFQGIV